MSYTFTSTRSITINSGNGAIDDPLSPNLTRVKYVENNETKFVNLEPINVAPTSMGSWESTPAFNASRFDVYARQTKNYEDSQGLPQKGFASVTIDNKTYYGYKNVYYAGFFGDAYPFNGLLAKTLIGGTITVVKYIANENLITTEQYSFSDSTVPASLERSACQYVGFAIPKQANDLILSISIEYPEE